MYKYKIYSVLVIILKTGVYYSILNWEEYKKQVKGFSNACYKKFSPLTNDQEFKEIR